MRYRGLNRYQSKVFDAMRFEGVEAQEAFDLAKTMHVPLKPRSEAPRRYLAHMNPQQIKDYRTFIVAGFRADEAREKVGLKP